MRPCLERILKLPNTLVRITGLVKAKKIFDISEQPTLLPGGVFNLQGSGALGHLVKVSITKRNLIIKEFGVPFNNILTRLLFSWWFTWHNSFRLAS
jgi:hypothetical protein